MGESDWQLPTTLLHLDPHELASWVNQIGELLRTTLLHLDPHELASWVNQIGSYHDAPPPIDPHELGSWVNQIGSYSRRSST